MGYQLCCFVCRKCQATEMSHGISGLQRIPNATEAEDVKTWNGHGAGAQLAASAARFARFFGVFHRETLVDF